MYGKNLKMERLRPSSSMRIGLKISLSAIVSSRRRAIQRCDPCQGEADCRRDGVAAKPLGEGFYNVTFAPDWTVASLWEMLSPGRAAAFLQR